MPDFEGEDLGRSREKFSGLIQCVMELPLNSLGLEDFRQLDTQLLHDMDPYSSRFPVRKKTQTVSEPDDPPCTLGAIDFPAGLKAKPAVSERVKWRSLPSFDALPYLDDPLVKF